MKNNRLKILIVIAACLAITWMPRPNRVPYKVKEEEMTRRIIGHIDSNTYKMWCMLVELLYDGGTMTMEDSLQRMMSILKTQRENNKRLEAKINFLLLAYFHDHRPSYYQLDSSPNYWYVALRKHKIRDITYNADTSKPDKTLLQLLYEYEYENPYLMQHNDEEVFINERTDSCYDTIYK